jgi:hypothetical protein
MRVIAYVASPLHILSALAAIETMHASQPPRVTVVVNYPTGDATLLKELHDIANVMTRGLPFIESCIAISNEGLDSLAGRTDVETAAKEFRARVDLGAFSEVYYFHDVMGLFFPMLAQSYPNARRICYGDVLGTTLERQYHLAQLGIEVAESVATADPAAKPSHWDRIRARLTKPWGSVARPPLADLSKLPFGLRSTLPHSAALILPVDESGDFLANIPWQIVPKELVLRLLHELVSRCSAFHEYENRLLAGRETIDKFLLMTECNAEAQFLTFERDVDMYCAIIEQHCTPRSTIFLKPHPAERFRRYDAICTRLADRYELIEFDPRFRRYPIEFATRLARECTPISMSYPSVSLLYLYGVGVIQPMNKAFIEKWYAPKYWDFLRRSRAMMDEPRERLATWDGRSLLWSGGAPR